MENSSQQKELYALVGRDHLKLGVACLLGIFVPPLAAGVRASVYPDAASEMPFSLFYSMLFLSLVISGIFAAIYIRTGLAPRQVLEEGGRRRRNLLRAHKPKNAGTGREAGAALTAVARNIAAGKQAGREAAEAEADYKGFVVECAAIGVYIYRDEHLAYVNPYIVNLLGYSAEELSSIAPDRLIYPEDMHLIRKITAEGTGSSSTHQFRIIKKDGSVIPVEIQASFIKNKGSSAIIGTLLDLTNQKETEEIAMKIAYHDILTGLPNRYLFNEHLYSAIQDCKKSGGRLCIMFLDLDRFKAINDTLGHSCGDTILQYASERLNSSVRKGDVVYRYGGDEFVILLKDAGKSESALLAENIIHAFDRPFVLDNFEVFSTTSIGLSFYPEDGDNVETLMKNADSALYLAKERGKNNYQYFSSCLNEQISKKMELENGLRKALANNEFLLHYQPQVDLATGSIVAVEALIRWQHPVYGLVPPLDFIPLAEETGLIIPIGKWVLETACKTCKAWQTAGLPSISISVNVSGYQLEHSDFVGTVRRILEKTLLDPHFLVLEITESVMQDVKKTHIIVDELKALGVKVAMDDFGIGYSSLNVLKYLNIDILKIDPSFINDAVTNPSAAILIKFIIDMGHQLKYDIVAEGIENEYQAALLRQSCCNLGQGYFFNRPLSNENIEKVLRNI
jgi:diguanylate cyclase (GGDEF)-like protein/PAS domain S-box-containing protein